MEDEKLALYDENGILIDENYTNEEDMIDESTTKSEDKKISVMDKVKNFFK